ncbi:MAG: hypothetical protein F2534_23565, partial [Actinobacteria bacterium]|nr:hypothetical protein [Actinomycetota bacterium]
MAPTRTPSRVLAVFLRHPEDPPAPPVDPPAPDEDLGEKGKAALDAERRARREAEKTAKQAADELAKVRAEADELRQKAMSDDEKKLAEALAAKEVEIRQAITAEADTKIAAAERRVLKERLKTAATSKLTNVADADVFVNVDDLERDAEGNVSDAALAAAVEALLKERPYLGAKPGGGSADQGHRRDAAPDLKDPKQLQAELAKLGVRP